ncbi:MAG: Do family serine endopeptidase [Bacteroidota bacterium]
MSKKSIFASLFLITIGIILGALLVSTSSNGIGLGLAGGKDDIKLGASAPPMTNNVDLKAASNAFVAVSKAVTPTVVSITVTTSRKKGERNMPQDFFHFFGPDVQPREPQKSQGSGSGVIVTADGYIITNNHVVEDADEGGIEVRMQNEKTRYTAKLIGTDPTTDLAVIKIDAKNLPVIALGNSDKVQVGEWVLAIGNPLTLTSTVTAGIVSAIGRNIDIIRESDGRRNSYGIENFIQTDAAINPGNSGGALVNIGGELIGINTAIATTNMRYQGYGFAVPVNIVKTVALDLIREGKVRRGYIGVQIKTVDQTMASAFGLDRAQGVLVDSVMGNGAAKSAGIKSGDIILSIDGKEVNESNELQAYIATKHAGDGVTLKIFRDGRTIEKKVTLKQRDDDKKVVKAVDKKDGAEEERSSRSSSVKFDNLGMTARSLNAEEMKEADVDNGVLVADVKPYGEAFNRGIGENDVIVEADRKDVKSPGDLKKIIEGKKPGDSLLLRVKKSQGPTTYIAVQIPK